MPTILGRLFGSLFGRSERSREAENRAGSDALDLSQYRQLTVPVTFQPGRLDPTFQLALSRLAQNELRRRTMSKYLVMVTGELQHGLSRQEVMEKLGGVYIGEAKNSRARLMVVDMPESGFLPLTISAIDANIMLPRNPLLGSIYEVPEQMIGRLDGFMGFGIGYSRNLTIREMVTFQMTSVAEGNEEFRQRFSVGGNYSGYHYITTDVLKSYLFLTNVPRAVVPGGDWKVFRAKYEAKGQQIVVAPPLGMMDTTESSLERMARQVGNNVFAKL